LRISFSANPLTEFDGILKPFGIGFVLGDEQKIIYIGKQYLTLSQYNIIRFLIFEKTNLPHLNHFLKNQASLSQSFLKRNYPKKNN
jgi:hypothetical protein